ncbi:MAG TPA: HAD family hydrolase [Kofleriaceae bacterium]|nr:HAD family hydrolase [Kofleriaceae bacterium]
MGQPFKYVVLDFDGTCTQIDRIYESFLRAYLEELHAANPTGEPPEADWKDALAQVIAASPKAGWTLMGVPSTAPAAADPYILAGEAAALLKRQRDALVLPDTAYAKAYERNHAPWRDEVAATLQELVDRGLKVGFISNSSTKVIHARLDDLLGAGSALREQIHVRGSAAKFKIQEIPLATSPAARHLARFERVPAIDLDGAAAIGRPIYLRRGSYFEALCALWSDFGEDGYPIAETIFCGDIWELDLALPQALGAAVHLVRRAAPFHSYPYELARVAPAHQSDDLASLLARV